MWFFLHMSTGLALVMVLSLCECSSKTVYNNPPCHAGMLHIFNWCEQSDCGNNCTCLEPVRVCKQVCGLPNCGLLFCSSPLTCHQSVLVDHRAPAPSIKKMVVHSPRAEQECNKGHCSLLKALRYDTIPTTTFQSCADGSCDKVHSSADVAQQFCGNCKSMRCMGKHATNCTQYCVLGKCNEMTCHAKHCKQLCLHSSECSLTCGENSETCEQVCSHHSNCSMKCLGKKCNQTCKQGANCTVIDVESTTAAPTTVTSTSTTSSSTTTKMSSTTTISSSSNIPTTEISNSVEVIKKEEPIVLVQRSSSASWRVSLFCLLVCLCVSYSNLL